MSVGYVQSGVRTTFFSQSLEGLDPLSALLQESDKDGIAAVQSSDVSFKWNDLLLTLNSKFKLSSEILNDQKSSKDKIASRLMQLENVEKPALEEGPQIKIAITAEEFQSYMKKLKGEVSELWKADQRVATLNTAIRAVLNLTQRLPSIPYPLIYAPVCNILDYFGDLVYDRVVRKGGHPSDSVLHGRKSIPPESIETAKNWLSKLVQIPDMVCRLYLEISCLRIHTVAQHESLDATLVRLATAIKGIPDPVIATYMRAYLLQGVNLHFANKARPGWYEQVWRDTYSSVSEGMSLLESFPEFEKVQNSLVAGLGLVFFGLDRGLGARFWTVVTARQCVTSSQSGLLLHAFIKAIPVAYVTELALFLTEATLNVKGFPHHKSYIALGGKISKSGVGKIQRRKVLSLAWKGVSQTLDLGKFLQMSEAWLGYVIKFHNAKDLDVIIGEVITGVKSRLTSGSRSMTALEANTLLAVLSRMLNDVDLFAVLLSLDHFPAFLELFPKPHARFSASKECLQKALSQKGDIPLLYLSPLLEICRSAYVSLTAVSADDDRRQVTNLVCGVIGKISTHWDVDAQLDLYVDLRKDFPDLEEVLLRLVERACQLAHETFTRKASSPSRQQAESFFATCAAFIFITIPSIRSPQKRLQLYILSGQTSAEIGCVGLAEASFGEAVKLFMNPEVLRRDMSEGEWLKECLRLAESMIMLSDHPDRGPLFLIRSLSGAQRNYTWESSEYRCKWLAHIYPLFCRLEALTDDLPGYFRELYSGNKEFQIAVREEKRMLLEDISAELGKMESAGVKQLQVSFAKALVHSLLDIWLVSDQDSLRLLLHLLKLIVKRLGSTAEARALINDAKTVLQHEPACERIVMKLDQLIA